MRDPDHPKSPDDLGDALREARPAEDVLGAEAARARARAALFGAAEPAKVGRFVLLGPIAGGGMGVVYGAYDPELDRRVALKVLRGERGATARARERLLGEARALARLDHPNVVPVHDVIAIGDEVVIVMELVAGQTVAQWERAAPRTWREVVAVYREVGRGLAAAHALGLVHRDVKADNAIVGDDGRVRVLDFGLARGAGDDDGEVAGTLAYMAPEQLADGTATTASDQFGFCVALHRAVHGVAPFAGDDAASLRANIAAGRRAVATDGRRIPGWLDAVVARGLAAEPGARFPTMTALLAELERVRGWRRWRVPALAVGVVAIAAAAALVARQGAADRRPACDGGAAAIGAVWNPARRDALQRHFDAMPSPYAVVVDGDVIGALDRYRDAWSLGHLDACMAHRRGEPAARHERRALCLDRRLDALRAAVTALDALDAGAADRALDIATRLPRIADCADGDALPAPPPPAVRDEVAAVRAALAEVEAADRAGRSADAVAAAAALVARAERVGHGPLRVETLLAHGRLLQYRDDPAAAATLARAEALAWAEGMDDAAVTAAARRIYVAASGGGDLAALVAEAEALEPRSRALRDHLARPLLLNNLGILHMQRGDRAAALAAFAAAHATLAGIDEPPIELTAIDTNLAMVTADGPRREALARDRWDRLRDRFGPAHPAAIEALASYGHLVDDPARALPLVVEACALYARYHAARLGERIDCAWYVAFLTAATGGDAAARYADVIALAGDATDPALRFRGALAAGHVALARGDAATARIHLAAALADVPANDAWANRKRAGHALLGLGLAATAEGHVVEARALLDRAAAAFAEAAARYEDVEPRLGLAATRDALAALPR